MAPDASPLPRTGTSPASPDSAAPGGPSADLSPTQKPAAALSGSSDAASPDEGDDDVATPLDRTLARPVPPARSISYSAREGSTGSTPADVWGSADSTSPSSRFSGPGGFVNQPNGSGSSGDGQRTTRAASDGAILGSFSTSPTYSGEANSRLSSRLSSLGSSSNDDVSPSGATGAGGDEQAFFREHQRRSLEHSASQRLSTTSSSAASKSAFSPPLASARLTNGGAGAATSPFFTPQQQQSSLLSSAASASSGTSPALGGTAALLSPTSTSPPSLSHLPPPAAAPSSGPGTPSVGGGGGNQDGGPPGSKGATLHLGDLDVWMDEAYVRECCALMGWDNVVNIKMSRGASPSSGYCFLTFPSTVDAARALARFNAAPPTLMPRSGRTFKLNWGTGLPGLQPRWDGEWSVFVGDLAREVGEADLMALFTPLFPSTKSAKVMCDPSTGLSRGYGFVRFAEESDMQRALRLGTSSHSGLLLHGRTIRISEASGPSAVEGLPHLRERTRTRSGDGQFAAQGQQQQQQQGYFPPFPPAGAEGAYAATESHVPFASPSITSPGGTAAYGNGANNGSAAAAAFPSPLSPYGGAPPALGHAVSPSLARGGPLSPRENSAGSSSGGGAGAGQGQGRQAIGIPQGAVPQGGDPNNTTVFVGGLPACISEETLKSFFHHFGEITYCKIPPGKGCGFVQFVRRQDAELAIAKMNDFPIHGKSRIRLSWGRSQGDKQVEHVRKLASALGVPFDAVWRMVQGQDNSTIKQIASAVGNGGPGSSSATAQQQQSQQQQQQSAASRMDLRAVANAAGLSESEVLDLVKNGNGALPQAGANGIAPTSSNSNSTAGSDFFARGSSGATSLDSATSPSSSASGAGDAQRGSNGGNGAPHYSRVSPSSFSAAFGPAVLGPPGMLPLSPPPTAGPNGTASFAHHQSQPHFVSPSGNIPPPLHSPSPYTAIRPESYLVQPPASSPYERVDFADGGRPSPNGFGGGAGGERYQPQAAFGFKWHDHAHAHPHAPHQPPPPPHMYDGGYTSMPPPVGIDESFANLSLGAPPRSLPPPARGGQHAFQPTAPDFFPGALASPTTQGQVAPGLVGHGADGAGEASWSWGGVSAA
ncbi:hypothetical protein Rhopal_001059-T1 [Rhodotorula paludigena]|uniref:RRM domain-containing protein n=1 Tax=Rhodotorula paludigena TaxID=86838 RepID=A0AAV5GHL4_9BASI|nr:hypothetical protein Rhopal_001059-T1 [Rhodotorula paludigena]